VVSIASGVIQNMGVRTTPVKRDTLWKYIRTQGTVAYDDDRILNIQPRTPGWVETLYIRSAGVHVERKDELLDFFSPSTLHAQMDLLDSLEGDELSAFESFQGPGQEEQKPRLKGTRDLLRYLKMSEMDLMRLEDTHQPLALLTMRAPQGGVVTHLGVREGMYVEPWDTLFTIEVSGQVIEMLEVQDQDIAEVLKVLAKESGVRMNIDPDVKGRVTIFLKSIDLRDALRVILNPNHLAFYEEKGEMYIMTARKFEKKYGYDSKNTRFK